MNKLPAHLSRQNCKIASTNLSEIIPDGLPRSNDCFAVTLSSSPLIGTLNRNIPCLNRPVFIRHVRQSSFTLLLEVDENNIG